MTIQSVINHLEGIAPPIYQESYDNAGLITGSPHWELTGVITSLDATEAVVEEAIDRGCNLIVAHHPIVFKGLKKITGANYVERTIIKAIKHDVAIYAIHTNLDNVLDRGVNQKIAQHLGLSHCRILAPKQMAYLGKVSVPKNQKESLKEALNLAAVPSGGFLPVHESRNGREEHFQLELRYDQGQEGKIKEILRQRGLLDGFQKIRLEGKSSSIGSGVLGMLPEAVSTREFLQLLKEKMKAGVVRHTELVRSDVQKIAVCGGAGSFLLKAALAQKADVFVTADYKYHEFFDADGKIIIADIGHYESEQFTIDLLHEIISETFSTFAVYKTRVNTNPVKYF